MDVFDDSSSSPSGTLRNYPLTCKVVYSYKVCDFFFLLNLCLLRKTNPTMIYNTHSTAWGNLSELGCQRLAG